MLLAAFIILFFLHNLASRRLERTVITALIVLAYLKQKKHLTSICSQKITALGIMATENQEVAA